MTSCYLGEPSRALIKYVNNNHSQKIQPITTEDVHIAKKIRALFIQRSVVLILLKTPLFPPGHQDFVLSELETWPRVPFEFPMV